MTLIVGEDKPSLEDLSHHGVLGMKWGKHRVKANGDQIIQARRRLENKQNNVWTKNEKLRASTKKGSDARKAGDAKLDAEVKKINQSKDRVIAARMTRGEKATAFVLAGPFGIIPVAASSLTSRRLEKKLDDRKKK